MVSDPFTVTSNSHYLFMRFQVTQNPSWVHGNSMMWRYLSLDRFIGMLETNTIFFTRASAFSDKYEFTLPASTAENLQRHLGEGALEKARSQLEEFRRTSFVSCWTKSPHESYSLWKIYIRDSNFGVAIRANASKLRKSLLENNDDKRLNVYHTEVEYNNHIPLDQVNGRKVASTKREFYDGENEARIFFTDTQNSLGVDPSQTGVTLNFDPSYVINEVYLSPFGGKSFSEAFQEMLGQRYGWLRNRVKQSEIRDL